MVRRVESSSRYGRLVRRLELGGVLVDHVAREQVVEEICESCERMRPLHVVTVNIHFLTLARRLPAFRRVINGAGLTVVDGRILLWASRLIGCPLPEQITGHDVMSDCIRLAAARKFRVLLLGGAPGVADQVALTLRGRHPALEVKALHGGRFSEEGGTDDVALAAEVRKFKPHMSFVALGAPKQEMWIARNIRALELGTAVGVGGVFDTLAGRLPRAPRWLQIAGLESLFQLIVEPRRYWRRYLLEDPPTLIQLVREIVARRLKDSNG